jgi:hypothetical protein
MAYRMTDSAWAGIEQTEIAADTARARNRIERSPIHQRRGKGLQGQCHALRNDFSADLGLIAV